MRDIEFVSYINEHTGISQAQAAADLGVSERTIRERVRRANEALRGCASIEFSRAHGYTLAVGNRAEFDGWLERQDAIREGLPPQTPSQRVRFLMTELLDGDEWVTLDALAERLFVSRWAISADIKEVERLLKTHGLGLEKKPRYGIRVTGPEVARRACLAALASSKETGHASHTASIPADNKQMEAITRCVNEALAEASLRMSAVAHRNLLVHIGVALARIERDMYVELDAECLEATLSSTEYAVAQRMADGIERETGLSLPWEEVAYLAIHLAGKHTVDADAANGRNVISDEVWELASAMIERLWVVFRFDFRNDLELRMNLSRHIMPLTVRLQYNMRLQNPLVDDIKARYPLAYSMALESSSILAERYGTAPSEDEMAYIALSFALAIERQHGEMPKKSLLIVCGSGAGSAHLLEYRCKREFGEYLGAIVTCDVRAVEQQDFSHIDYVFTTVPLECSVPVPVRQIGPFLDPEEAGHLKALFSTARLAEPNGILRYFSHDLFFPHLTCADKQETIGFLLSRVRDKRAVPQNLDELVWQREQAMPTSFGNGVAMPHPLEGTGSSTFVCVGILDEPVAWNGDTQLVSVVLLSVFAANAGTELQGFYAALADLIMDADAIASIVRNQTWEALELALTSATQQSISPEP